MDKTQVLSGGNRSLRRTDPTWRSVLVWMNSTNSGLLRLFCSCWACSSPPSHLWLGLYYCQTALSQSPGVPHRRPPPTLQAGVHPSRPAPVLPPLPCPTLKPRVSQFWRDIPGLSWATECQGSRYEEGDKTGLDKTTLSSRTWQFREGRHRQSKPKGASEEQTATRQC